MECVMVSFIYRCVFLGMFLSLTVIQANPIAQQIDDVERYQEQKRVFEENAKNIKEPTSIYTDLKFLALQSGNGTSGACIQVDRVHADDIKLIAKEKLEQVIKPYLHRCNTISEINNLVKKINNIYIEKAYITSRAYIKAQDLSKGDLNISAMEGKIESIEGKNIVTELIFFSPEDEYLNLRKLEMGIEQLNRLKSYQAKMAINPGTKVGYSKIVMNGTRSSFPIHGSMSVNNFGTEKSGKYQLSGSMDWENPLGWNDILSLSYNTTNKQDEENDSLGHSISYGLPIGQSYLKMTYSYFKYKQIVNGLNVDYASEGKSKSFKVNLEHKLFHGKNERGKFDISLQKKKNDNYLAGEYLSTSSSTLAILQLGYTHNYTSTTWDGYATLKYHQGLDILGAKTGTITSPKFKKMTFDLSYNKRIEYEDALPARYNLSFHGQYAKQGIIGSQQIGIGGPYSVRGFKNEGSLSGNMGFYIRNEFSFIVNSSWGTVSPYLGLDIGAVKKNDSSNGGGIIGHAAGVRINTYGVALDIFATQPLYNSNKNKISDLDDEVHSNGSKFIGFNLSYQF